MRVIRRLVVALLAVLAVIWFLSLFAETPPAIEQGSVLVLDIQGEYVEGAEAPLVSRLLGDAREPFVSLLTQLRKAQRDDRLKGLVLRIRNLDIGWGKAEELREAIANVAESGLTTIAYLEVESLAANLEYFVATGASEIRVSPGTRSPLVGLAGEFLFLGGLWEKLGIEFEVERVGEYKTAAEAYAGREMSEAYREMANSLLDSLDALFVAGIAAGRDVSVDFVRSAIDSAPVTPQEMLGLGLIDAVSSQQEIIASFGEAPVVRAKEYARVDPAELGFEPVARFALVYGSGIVVPGRDSGAGAAQRLDADEVSRALDEAVEDESIDALIFRIDSPGGSALASELVWNAVERAKKSGKPLIASFSDLAASGGYYVACGADTIVAPATSLTGSIGVYVLRPVVGDLLDKLGIGVETMTRGRHADLLLSSKPLSEASRRRLRREVESIYELFVERVADGRELDAERVDELGRGRVWTGAQAAELGLVDALGGLRVAVEQGREALGLKPDADVALVPYPPPRSLLAQIDEAMRRMSLAAGVQLPLGSLVRQLETWLVTLPTGTPLAIPPFFTEIH